MKCDPGTIIQSDSSSDDDEGPEHSDSLDESKEYYEKEPQRAPIEFLEQAHLSDIMIQNRRALRKGTPR